MARQTSPGPTAEKNRGIPEFVTRLNGGGYQSISAVEDITSSGRDQKREKSRRAYIWGGAAIGGLITVVALIITIGGADTGFAGNPIVLLPVVVGGAVIGGLVGALISR